MPSQSRLISMGNPLKTIAQMPIIILDATFRTESKRLFEGIVLLLRQYMI